MNKRSKRYNQLNKKFDKNKQYLLLECCDMIKKVSSAKFNESIDIAINLNLNKNNNFSGNVIFPYNVKKNIKIAVFAEGNDIIQAKNAGADMIGAESLAKDILEKKIHVDKVITSTNLMHIVGKLGKVLGPQGLMPNLNNGTITNNIFKSVNEFKKGKSSFKSDKNGIIHLSIGKASFSEHQLALNIKVLINKIIRTNSNSVKNDFIKKHEVDLLYKEKKNK